MLHPVGKDFVRMWVFLVVLDNGSKCVMNPESPSTAHATHFFFSGLSVMVWPCREFDLVIALFPRRCCILRTVESIGELFVGRWRGRNCYDLPIYACVSLQVKYDMRLETYGDCCCRSAGR
jgi:hypothetical protein